MVAGLGRKIEKELLWSNIKPWNNFRETWFAEASVLVVGHVLANGKTTTTTTTIKTYKQTNNKVQIDTASSIDATGFCREINLIAVTLEVILLQISTGSRIGHNYSKHILSPVMLLFFAVASCLHFTYTKYTYTILLFMQLFVKAVYPGRHVQNVLRRYCCPYW